MKPYVPIFSSTPARITEPAVGASTCASGSHVCSGTIGTLIANDSAKAASSTVCTGSGNSARYRSANANDVTPVVAFERIHEIDHRGEHQDAAERRVEHELERRVDPPLAAPDADDEEERDQHRLPEQVEQEQVLRDERAEHRELQREHHRVEELHVLLDGGERARDDQRAEEGRQQDEQHVVAVEADLVIDAPGRDPRQPRLELQAVDGRIEPRVEKRGQRRTAASSRRARAAARDPSPARAAAR